MDQDCGFFLKRSTGLVQDNLAVHLAGDQDEKRLLGGRCQHTSGNPNLTPVCLGAVILRKEMERERSTGNCNLKRRQGGSERRVLEVCRFCCMERRWRKSIPASLCSGLGCAGQ
jgi:hypothetical protein